MEDSEDSPISGIQADDSWWNVNIGLETTMFVKLTTQSSPNHNLTDKLQGKWLRDLSPGFPSVCQICIGELSRAGRQGWGSGEVPRPADARLLRSCCNCDVEHVYWYWKVVCDNVNGETRGWTSQDHNGKGLTVGPHMQTAVSTDWGNWGAFAYDSSDFSII